MRETAVVAKPRAGWEILDARDEAESGVEIDKPKNGDAAAIALLRWIFAALLLLNGGAFILAATSHGFRQSLFDGVGWNYAAGLLCAFCGGACWTVSYASASRSRGRASLEPIARHTTRPEQAGSDDRAIAFGGMAIMLWVASLTSFVIGCEQLSWLPAGAHDQKLLQQPAGAEPRPILARSNLIQAGLGCGRGSSSLHCAPAR
jgi:hypothetical protein